MRMAYEDEDNEPMMDELPFSDPPEEGENCHEYCPYAKQCRYAEGSVNLEPECCDMYWTLDPIIKAEKADRRRDEWRDSQMLPG